MKFYIAARWQRRAEAHSLAKSLIQLGHSVTSRWITEDRYTTGTDAECAEVDLQDVLAADTVVSLTEIPRGNSRGGRHVEFGLALGNSKRVVVVGPRENVFHSLETVEHFDSVTDFIKYELEQHC